MVAAGIEPGRQVWGSLTEHHSNLLPWRARHQFTPLPLREDGQIDLEAMGDLARQAPPQLVALSTITNAFGFAQPTERLIELAHASGAEVLLDVNQSVAHAHMDVAELDCDYLCFSGHKLGGPTGVGVLYAKRERLDRLQPVVFGGGMVESVSAADDTLADLPMRLEAGTPAYEAVVGLAAACDFMTDVGLEEIQAHEQQLTNELAQALGEIPRVEVRRPENTDQQGAIVAFHVDGLEAHGVARMLSNRANICVRSGFHCAQPAHEAFGWRPTVRASFGVYNTRAEVECLANAVAQITANLP